MRPHEASPVGRQQGPGSEDLHGDDPFPVGDGDAALSGERAAGGQFPDCAASAAVAPEDRFLRLRGGPRRGRGAVGRHQVVHFPPGGALVGGVAALFPERVDDGPDHHPPQAPRGLRGTDPEPAGRLLVVRRRLRPGVAAVPGRHPDDRAAPRAEAPVSPAARLETGHRDVEHRAGGEEHRAVDDAVLHPADEVLAFHEQDRRLRGVRRPHRVHLFPVEFLHHQPGAFAGADLRQVVALQVDRVEGDMQPGDRRPDGGGIERGEGAPRVGRFLGHGSFLLGSSAVYWSDRCYLIDKY